MLFRRASAAKSSSISFLGRSFRRIISLVIIKSSMDDLFSFENTFYILHQLLQFQTD